MPAKHPTSGFFPGGRAILFGLPWLAFAARGYATEGAGATGAHHEAARAVLAQASLAYQRVPAMAGTMHIHVGRKSAEAIELQVDFAFSDRGASIDAGRCRLTALGDRFYATLLGVPDRCLDLPLEENLLRTAEQAIEGFAEFLVPVQLPLRLGRGFDECVQAMSLAKLRDVEVVSCQPALNAGATRVRWVGNGGWMEADFDAETHRIAGVALGLDMQGRQVKASIKFEEKVLAGGSEVVRFDPGGRRAVSTYKDLLPRRVEVGDDAPDLQLLTESGEGLRPADWKGSIVVLDFWATWCPPCRASLPLLQRFTDSAAERGQSVKVYAVNTWETFPTEKERREKVTAVVKTTGLRVPVVYDRGSRALTRYSGTGVPCTAVIGLDGKVAYVHRGFDSKMVERLEQVVEECLSRRSAAPISGSALRTDVKRTR